MLWHDRREQLDRRRRRGVELDPVDRDVDGVARCRPVEMAAPADRQPVGALLEADRRLAVPVGAGHGSHVASGATERRESS